MPRSTAATVDDFLAAFPGDRRVIAETPVDAFIARYEASRKGG